MATLKKVTLFNPLLVQCRHRSKLNIKRPQKAHFDRRIFEAVTIPILPEDLHNPARNCPRLRRKLEQPKVAVETPVVEHRYEKFLVGQCRKVFEDNQMIVVFQPMAMSERERWELWVKLHKNNLHLRSFGNKIIKLTINDTKWANMAPLFIGRNALVTSPEMNVSTLVKVTQKIPQLVMLGGLVDNRIMTKAAIVDYAKLPSLDGLRGELVGILNTGASKTRSFLGQHQGALSRNLDQFIKDNTPTEAS